MIALPFITWHRHGQSPLARPRTAAGGMATTVDAVTGTSLTAHEKRVVLTHRVAWFLWEGQFGVHRAASTAKWLVLTGGDAGLMAQYMGTAW